MVLVQSIDEARLHQVKSQKTDSAGSAGITTKIPFFGSRNTPDVPHAFLTQWDPAWVSGPHFHENDQFQVVVAGLGKLGRRSLPPYTVHFSGAYTPYGPLSADTTSPLSFLVMRPRYDAGSQRLPRLLEKLKAVPNRQPLQITRDVSFPALPTGADTPGVMLKEVPDMQNDTGLASYTLAVKPNVRTYAPDPSRSGGQFLVVVGGSLLHHDKEYKSLALVFVPSNEGPFEICAGAEGLQVLVLDFPRPATIPSIIHAHPAGGLKRWQCQLCGIVYDEEAGWPEDGIAPGTRWEDVPASWNCPDCSASKAEFEMVELEKAGA